MKKQLLTIIGFLTISFNAFATQYYITNSSDTYVPSFLQVNVGDTVNFMAGPTHTTRQVSAGTWVTNDTTMLGSGFGDLGPGGIFIPSSLGNVYYVCVEHVQSDQMKGLIYVSQLGIESNKSITMQIMQSVSEQYLKLVITGNGTGNIHVEMLNLSGQVVKTIGMELNGDETVANIPVGDMPKGVYMIRWSYGNVNKARKIILQ